MSSAPARLLLAFAGLLAAPAAPAAPTPGRYVEFSSAEEVGAVVVTVSGREVDVDYRRDSNGRGEKQREHVVLGEDGAPVLWTITGTRNAGAPVDERFERTAAAARWSSPDGRGEAAQPGPSLYLPNDGSPWALGLYVELLLAAPGQRRAVLPGGELRLEKVRDLRIGPGGREATAWALWGLGFSPTLVLTDRAGGRWLGVLWAGGPMLEESLVPERAALDRLALELDAELLARLTGQLTHRFEAPIWLVDVRIFDPETMTRSAPTALVVHRGRVVGTRAGPPPPWAVVIDGQGGTVLPGLHDLHAHTWGWDGPLHLAAGVTTIRDPGNDNASLLDLVRRREAGELLGPRTERIGFLEGRSPFSVRGDNVFDTLEKALARVRWYADHGYIGIKIYNSMPPAWVAPLAAEAHRLGLSVSGHVPAFMTSEQALRDGYDEINHVNQLALSWVIGPKEDTRTPFRFTALGERMATLDLGSAPVRRTLEVMKARHATLDPTMGVFKALLLSRPGQAPPGQERWLGHMPEPIQRAARSAALDVKPALYPTYQASWAKLEALLRQLDGEGINLVPGTDGYAGFSLHDELEAWVAAGIPAPRVLRAATLGAARHVHADPRLGLLRPGHPAELLLVPGDPTADIGLVRQARLVMARGAVYFPEEIHRALGIAPFAGRPPVRPPAAE